VPDVGNNGVRRQGLLTVCKDVPKPDLAFNDRLGYKGEMTAETNQLNEQIAASVALLRRHL